MGFVKIDLDKKPEPEPKWAHIEEEKLTFEEVCENLEGIDGDRLYDVNRYNDKAIIAAAMKMSRDVGYLNQLIYSGTFAGSRPDENEIMRELGQIMCEMYVIADYFNKDLGDVAKEAMKI